MKEHYELALVDLSPEMLGVSRRLNPECEHIEGDMRFVRLGREFDGVFVHDALAYMTTGEDLRRALETARVHLRPGGAAVLVPDYVRETFRPGTKHGGHDGGDGRGLRYVEWTQDAAPESATYLVDYGIVLREPDGSVTVEHDRHVEGLFGRDEWLGVLRDVGLAASVVRDSWGRDVFVARATS